MIFTGLLSAGSPSLAIDSVIKDLRAASSAPVNPGAEYGGPLPQVHALNCLKALFITAKLGAASEPYIPVALNLAGVCLTSKVWSIRNCGIMLFRALVDRLFGSVDTPRRADQNNHTRFSWREAPGLLDIVTRLLSPSEDRPTPGIEELECVFPALQLLQRVAPPPGSVKEIKQLVLLLCSNSHWHIRDMAARTYVSLISEPDFLSCVKTNLSISDGGQNALHGRLLLVKYALRSHLFMADDTTLGELSLILEVKTSIAKSARKPHTDHHKSL